MPLESHRVYVRCCAAALLLVMIAGSCQGAKRISIGELGVRVRLAAANHRSDKNTAEELEQFELTERLTDDSLAALQSEAPGARTATTLQELADQSAFLQPPRSDLADRPAPGLAEQSGIIRKAAQYARHYVSQLPNFMCDESIRRFNDLPVPEGSSRPKLGSLRFSDSLVARVTYSHRDEAPVITAAMERNRKQGESTGLVTYGEFGNIIVAIFLPASQTKATWSHWERLRGETVAVFHYAVQTAHSSYQIAYGTKPIPGPHGTRLPSTIVAGYEGYLFIETETGAIFRITRQAAAIPTWFPTRRADTAVEYGPVSIGGQIYICPIRSVTQSDSLILTTSWVLHSLNDIRFVNYRKFEVESGLIKKSWQPPVRDLATTATLTAPQPSPQLPESPPELNAEIAPGETASLEQILFPLPQLPPFRPAPAARSAGEAAKEASFETHAIFRERLSVVTVPVIVRDRKGEAVPGLTKDDFALFDNGKRQLLSAFSVQVPAPQEASPVSPNKSVARVPIDAMPDKYLAYVFDDLHLTLGDLSQSRDALKRRLRAGLEPGTRIALFTTSGRYLLDFTKDIADVEDTLQKIQVSARHEVPMTCPPVSPYLADRVVNRNDSSALKLLAMEAIARCGISGRDAQSMQQAQRMAQSAARTSLNVDELDTRTTFQAIGAMVRRMAVLPASRQMVLISPGFLTLSETPDFDRVLDRAVRSGVVVNTLDARGLYTAAGFDASIASTGNADIEMQKRSYDTTEQHMQSDVLLRFADATAGESFQNSNDYAAGLRRLGRTPTVTYLLGFTPQNTQENGRYHKLRVKLVDRRGMEVQARRGYFAAQPQTDRKAQAKQEIENALFSRDEAREIPLSVRILGPEVQAEPMKKLTVIANIDIRGLQFQNEAGHNRDTLDAVFALFDSNGNFLGAVQETVPLDITDDHLPAVETSRVRLQSSLDWKPGAGLLRVVVRDSQGQLSTVNKALGTANVAANRE